MVGNEYHLDKDGKYYSISYGWNKSYIQKRNIFGIKHWYDMDTNKRVSKVKEKELNDRLKNY